MMLSARHWIYDSADRDDSESNARQDHSLDVAKPDDSESNTDSPPDTDESESVAEPDENTPDEAEPDDGELVAEPEVNIDEAEPDESEVNAEPDENSSNKKGSGDQPVKKNLFGIEGPSFRVLVRIALAVMVACVIYQLLYRKDNGAPERGSDEDEKEELIRHKRLRPKPGTSILERIKGQTGDDEEEPESDDEERDEQYWDQY